MDGHVASTPESRLYGRVAWPLHDRLDGRVATAYMNTISYHVHVHVSAVYSQIRLDRTSGCSNTAKSALSPVSNLVGIGVNYGADFCYNNSNKHLFLFHP